MRKAGKLKPKCQPGGIEHVALQVRKAGRQIGGRDPARIGMDAKPVHQSDRVRRESDADRHVGEGIFEDQVPADDPGDELAQRGVGVGIGGAGDGDHRRELGVAEPGEAADDGDEHEGEGERRSGAGTPGERGVVNEVIENRGVENGGGIELLARNGGADDGKNARADDGSDAERGKRHGPERFLETRLGVLRVGDELVDRFTGKEPGAAESDSSKR